MLKLNICLEKQKKGVSLTCQTIRNNTNFKKQYYGNFNQLSSNSSSDNDSCEKRENKWSRQRN